MSEWGAKMKVHCFIKLASTRQIKVSLSSELADFYSRHEGIGLSSSPDIPVRICRLEEVARIGWRDLHILGNSECPGWEAFSAFRIGMGQFFDEIVAIIEAPVCPTGSIMAFGVDVAGPGGEGPATVEPSLVLAPNLTEWLSRLKANDGIEYGLVPGGIAKMPKQKRVAMQAYYRALNPHIAWP